MNGGTVRHLDQRIDAIVAYLARCQHDDGYFAAVRRFPGAPEPYATPTEHEGWHEFGRCPFMTATIVYHLGAVRHADVAGIRRRACAFLAGTFERGLVRYVPARYQDVWFPTDVDDSCLVARALRDNGWAVPLDERAILRNTDRAGGLYTWMLPRWRLLPDPGLWWWLARDWWQYARRLYRQDRANARRLLREYREASEPAVLANVLLHFCNDARTRRFVEPLLAHSLTATPALEYYASLAGLFFHVARLYDAGERSMAAIAPRATAHIRATQRPDGMVGNAFDTAIAALTLMYLGRWGDSALGGAMDYLASDSMHETGWWPFPYVNPVNRAFSDGAAALTATLYLDALSRYRAHLSPP